MRAFICITNPENLEHLAALLNNEDNIKENTANLKMSLVGAMNNEQFNKAYTIKKMFNAIANLDTIDNDIIDAKVFDDYVEVGKMIDNYLEDVCDDFIDYDNECESCGGFCCSEHEHDNDECPCDTCPNAELQDDAEVLITILKPGFTNDLPDNYDKDVTISMSPDEYCAIKNILDKYEISDDESDSDEE